MGGTYVVTNLQNDQSLTFVGNNPTTMFQEWQSIICQCLGIVSELEISATMSNGYPTIYLDPSTGPVSAIQSGFLVNGEFGIPNGTTVIGISGDIVTLSNNATYSGEVPVFFTDPAANTAVRQGWQTEGAPAWTIGQDVCSIQCVEIDDAYDKIRNSALQNNGSNFTEQRVYTRVWEIKLVFRGPNSFDHARIVRSMLLYDYGYNAATTQAGVYVVPNIEAPIRSPELFQGQWWEVSNLNIKCYEEVLELFGAIGQVESVPIAINNESAVIDQPVRSFTVTS